MHGRLAHAFLTLMPCVLLTACIGFPVAFPEERPFVATAEESLAPGVTTAADVERLFGDPYLQSPDQWIYHGERQGWAWFFCVAAYYSGDCATTTRTASDHFMVVNFDDRILLSYEVLKSRQLCDEEHVCVRDHLVSMHASEEANGESHAFLPPVVGCYVYVFPRRQVRARIEIDGKRAGDIVERDTFHRFTAVTGSSSMVIHPLDLPPIGAVTLECHDRRNIFVQYRMLKAEILEEEAGREAVASRRLVDSSGGFRIVNVYD